ncbi:MAG: tRNA-dihydrouridine synthase, partial [Planctomycetaceae bacterium]
IDDHDSDGFLRRFIESVAAAGCDTFVVHARRAILAGLSPKQNRSVPELDYERVYRLKRDYPELTVVLNGGIRTVGAAATHLRHVDGIMIGREAYHNPWFLVELERALGGAETAVPAQRHEVVQRMLPYIEGNLADGTELKHMTRHMLGLFAGQPGARSWRRMLSENAQRPGAGSDVVRSALPSRA